jgi:hypothetical protein
VHDDGHPDRCFVHSSSDTKVNFLWTSWRESNTVTNLRVLNVSLRWAFSLPLGCFAEAKAGAQISGPHRRRPSGNVISTTMLSMHPSTKGTLKRLCTPQHKIDWPWPNCTLFHCSERLLVRLWCFNNFACDRILSWSDYMHSCSGKHTSDGNRLVMFGTHKACASPTWPKRRYHFSEQLRGPLLRHWYFVCGRIIARSDHMQGVARNDWVAVDLLTILGARRHLWAPKMAKLHV